MSGIQHIRSHRIVRPGPRPGPRHGGAWNAMQAALEESPAPGTREPEPHAHGVLLKSAIETQILPRLLRLHPSDLPPARPPCPAEGDMAGLALDCARLAAGRTPDQVLPLLLGLRDAGAAPERLCLDILAPAARHLGEMWCEDTLDFVSVTIGTLALQRTMRRLLAPGRTVSTPAFRPSILMAQAPGSQHGFGLAMAADLFRLAGWSVTEAAASPGASLGAMLGAMLRTRRFDAVGFSLSGERQLDGLRRALDAVRAAGGDPGPLTVVGGPLPAADPALAAQLEADLIASDAGTAPGRLAALLERRAGAGRTMDHEG